ncbi:MAG: hypothetical protein GC131_07995 [Alphaproteobacteria bacterium]|nr:hypothetical protein [Alphaproteobacteria bacterium]
MEGSASKPGVFELLGRSWGEIKARPQSTVILALLFSTALVFSDFLKGDGKPENVTMPFIAQVFMSQAWFYAMGFSGDALWRKGNSKDQQTSMHSSLKYGGYALLAFLLIFFSGFVGTVLVGKAGSMLVSVLFAVIAGLFVVPFLFVFPALAFGHQASLPLAWRQSKGWYRRLLGGIVVITLIQLVVGVLLGVLVGLLIPASLGWLATGILYTAVMALNLLSYGYLAHTYLAATGLSKPDFSVTVS